MRIIYHNINVSNSAVLSHCVFFILKVLPKCQHGAQRESDYPLFSPVNLLTKLSFVKLLSRFINHFAGAM